MIDHECKGGLLGAAKTESRKDNRGLAVLVWTSPSPQGQAERILFDGEAGYEYAADSPVFSQNSELQLYSEGLFRDTHIR